MLGEIVAPDLVIVMALIIFVVLILAFAKLIQRAVHK